MDEEKKLSEKQPKKLEEKQLEGVSGGGPGKIMSKEKALNGDCSSSSNVDSSL